MGKCEFEGCENKAVSRGLCSNHYNQRWNFGNEIGVYKLVINDKIYIGSAVKQGIETEIQKHKSEMINNFKKHYEKNQDRKLFKYFNELCIKELGEECNDIEKRKELLDKISYYDAIYFGHITTPIEITEDGIKFFDNDEMRRGGWKMKYSENPELKKAYERTKHYWHGMESYCIKIYKDLDLKKGTDNCLND